MKLRVHELHASTIHAPLALVPAAAIVDGVAAIKGDERLAGFGKGLWIAGALGGLVAGLGGIAASQEVKAEDPHARDMMFLHGIANLGVVAAVSAMAIYRLRAKPSLLQAAMGLAGSGLAVWTAYLGGEMVYAHGVGVKGMPDSALQGVAVSPPVLSREAAPTLAKDTLRGFRWLFDRAQRWLSRSEPLAQGVTGLRPEARVQLPPPSSDSRFIPAPLH